MEPNRFDHWNRCQHIHHPYDTSSCIPMITKKTLQAISLIISSLVLLYLLFINLYRGSFIISDWVVVTVDLLAKTVIEIILLIRRD